VKASSRVFWEYLLALVSKTVIITCTFQSAEDVSEKGEVVPVLSL